MYKMTPRMGKCYCLQSISNNNNRLIITSRIIPTATHNTPLRTRYIVLIEPSIPVAVSKGFAAHLFMTP